ncbi:MAG: periplasmic heavy metal sensor [Planctomycetota bacterium]
MKKLLVTSGILLLVLAVAFPVFCDEPQKSRHGRGYGYGCEWGPGYGGGGSHMMGPGYGPGMHRGGWGMYGRGRMIHSGWERGHGPRDWQSMEPEQREKWEKMRSKYQMETLELRKQLVTKQMELETLWDQPDVDQKKVEKLSDEVAELQAELGKKHDKYLLQCRKDFGDKGWRCPGGW